MRKNQDNNASKKADEKSMKTGSEKKDSAKKKALDKKPVLNEPLYDVNVDENGRADVVSEKAIEEIDYPPELAEFLGEVLQGQREQLGLSEGEEFPADYLQEFFKKLFSEVDINKLVHELRCEKVFGLEPDESVKPMPILDEEEDLPEDESADRIPDEMLANLDYSKLEVNERGQRIFADFVLDCPENPMGIIEQYLPVKIDEDAIKNHVYAHVVIPFLEMIPLASITPGSEHYEETGTFLMDETNAYKLHTETFMDLQELLEKIGISEGQVVVKEGEDVAQKISEYIEEGNAIEGDFSAREDGYYDDLCEYWYDGKIYHEKDVIWLELPKTVNMMGVIKGFSANLDSFAPIYSPCDITHAKGIMVSNYRRILSNQEKFEIYYYKLNKDFFEQLTPAEEIWYLASEYAKTMETPGFCVVCLNGKFNVPVESFFNYDTFESEDLITIFNVVGCFPNHHRCAGLLVADIGNMQFHTAVRYCNGHVFDWQKRINQEIEAYRLDNPDFDPYDDPYDNPYNAE